MTRTLVRTTDKNSADVTSETEVAEEFSRAAAAAGVIPTRPDEF
jgi:hypothetical protein